MLYKSKRKTIFVVKLFEQSPANITL